MGKRIWTPQQEQAINARGTNLLVSAAAGAGKTSVLVQRIVNLVRDPAEAIDIDQLLVVTFTNAAAAQMREQIARELSKEICQQPSSRHLQRQIALLNCAQIATIHSFCLDVLRQYFYRIDLDPGFRVADDGETSLLELEVLEELLESKYQEENNQAFLNLVNAYGGERDDAGLIDMVLKIYRFIRSLPWYGQWIRQAADAFMVDADDPMEVFPWCDTLKNHVLMELNGAVVDLRQALDLSMMPGGPAVYYDTIAEELELIQSICGPGLPVWEELYNKIQTIHFGRLKAVKKNDEVDKEIQKRVQSLRDGVKKQLGEIKRFYFERHPHEYVNDIRSMGPLMKSLTELVLEMDESFSRAKTDRGIVDFSDLEHHCLRILLDEDAEPGEIKPSPAALEFQKRFAEVLVDEYQDVNAVQEIILQLVSRQEPEVSNLFMVGDVKQSIYRFRQADPGLFLHKYGTYPTQSDGRSLRINLRENFRSRNGVVAGINHIFKQIMTPVVGEMAYNEESELVCGFDYPPCEDGISLSPEVELFIIDNRLNADASEEPAAEEIEGEQAGREPGAGEEDEQDQLDKYQIEARLAARRIRQMMSDKPMVWDSREDKHRPLQYSDIAILMRAAREAANIFVNEFRGADIPVYADLGTGYFEATEVETLLSLLKVIDNPQQDIPLVAVLRSPLVGMDSEELAMIRLCDRDNSYYKALLAARTVLEGDTAEKIDLFLNRLENWRSTARRQRIVNLLWDIYRETGFYDYVGAMPAGAQRQANLRLMQSWADKYESTAFRGLFHFLVFVDRLRESGGDIGMARTLSENEDVVRIMSIHKSKGLEFPVVFVAGMGRQFNSAGLRETILVHRQLGIGPQFVDTDLSINYPTLAKLALRRQIKMETLAEEMRLLYVAMTRAREKMIMLGTVSDAAGAAFRWSQAAMVDGEAFSDIVLARARNYLDWISPSLCKHPDGQLLRQLAGIAEHSGGCDKFGAEFSINIVKADEIGQVVNDEALQVPALLEAVRLGELLPETAVADEIARRLGWEYPYGYLAGKGSKVTVTELKRLYNAAEAEEALPDPIGPAFIKKPRFIQAASELNAAERGTATHLVMQHLDLKSMLDEEGIRNRVSDLVTREILTPEQAAAINVDAVVDFFTSDLGRRVLNAREVMREVSFTMALPAGEVYFDIEGGTSEKVIVQGVIDCLADEGDGFVVIDYKTDARALERIDELTDTYRWQLDMYARAVETIFKGPVKEKYLYFLSDGITQKLD